MYHPNPECVIVTMKLCSILCVVATSVRRQNIKRDMMLLGGSYTGSCARNMELSDKCYEHSPKSIEENEEVKLLWNFTIQTDREIHHRSSRPDIVIQKKKAKETIIVDIAVPGDSNVRQKETKKYEKYQHLVKEMKRMWKSRTKVVPVVVGGLGSVSKKLTGHLEQLGIKDRTRTMQKSALLGSACILRKVLEV
ncbi:uncharacterized protein [Montipora capricornis]|uniref:uncharacterized protein n=1 Tax=Montipora capricornis TaxID=246305 RepID=UPI0035F1B537